MDPQGLKFSRTHEWVHLDGQTATVGISEFAVKELTDLVYIDLPKVGANVTAGEPFGAVESVKAVSVLYAPVSGEVTAVNETLADDILVLSADAFGKGWIAKIKVSGADAVDHMVSYADYEKFCASGGH
ncbi:MAG: glycine cleavage system protein GcvH [Planctomycetaceae bacterium]